MATTVSIKQEAIRLVQALPEGATWEDLMESICAREAIERGYAQSEAGLGCSVAEVRASYGLEP